MDQIVRTRQPPRSRASNDWERIEHDMLGLITISRWGRRLTTMPTTIESIFAPSATTGTSARCYYDSGWRP
jgi:hypothetical protein